MKYSYLYSIGILILSLCTISCTLDNVEDENSEPKVDFSRNSYVLATEDASTADITRFFSFELNDVDPNEKYDLIKDNHMFINSDPSTSSGHHHFKNFIFSMAKDKKGFSSTPGLFRLTQNTSDRIFIDNEIFVGKDNLYPARKLAIVDEHKAFFFNESVGGQTIQMFDPTTMQLLDQIDLRPYIEAFRPDAVFEDEHGDNLVRTGSFVLDYVGDKLYVSVAFLEMVDFNLISEEEDNFYLAVIDIPTLSFEKIISYEGVKNVGFYVSENNPTTKDEQGNLYFSSWGWNQFYEPFPSKVFRIKSGETEFDEDWEIDIEGLFGEERIVQSIISYNNKLYLHVSTQPYLFTSSVEIETQNGLEMKVYEFDPATPDQYRELDMPTSNPSPRINIFNIIDDKLFIATANAEGNLPNGVYSVDRNGEVKKEFEFESKYRPTRLYKLEN